MLECFRDAQLNLVPNHSVKMHLKSAPARQALLVYPVANLAFIPGHERLSLIFTQSLMSP